MHSWDMSGGHEMSVEEIAASVDRAGFSGVTFSGGDPLYQIEELTQLAALLRKQGYNLWCYTGFLWEDIAPDNRFIPFLQTIDVLVDGPFILSERDTDLLFRGSSNQRPILSQESVGSELKLYSPEIVPCF